MTLTQKYAGLITGIIVVFTSFLFFGRNNTTYSRLLLLGLLLSLLFFAMILIGKHSLKSKLTAVAIVIICMIAEQIVEPFLIDTSYSIFIRRNNTALTEINSILADKPGNISIFDEDIKDDSCLLTPLDKQRILESKKKLKTYMILKSSDQIYYELWGFLDIRLGITYWIGKSQPNAEYRHLTGAWYH